MNWQPANLEDNLIQLVPLKNEDFEALFKVASDPLVWEQHPVPDRYKPEVFKVFFDLALESGTAFCVVDKDSGSVIGSTRFYAYQPDQSAVAIGYSFLARSFWGGRYNQSMKKLMIGYAFAFVDNIYFHVGKNNFRSQKAIEKLGATKYREMDLEHYGQKLPHFEYLIKKEA